MHRHDFFNTRNVGFFQEGAVGAEEEKVFAVRWARASHVESSRLTPTTQTSDVGSNAPRKKLIDERWCGDIFHNKRVCFLLVFFVCVVMSMCFRIRQRARNKSVGTILRITLAHPPSFLHKLNYWNDLKVHELKGLSQPDPYCQSGDICEITFPSTIYKFERRSRDEIYCRATRPETKMRMEKSQLLHNKNIDSSCRARSTYWRGQDTSEWPSQWLLLTSALFLGLFTSCLALCGLARGGDKAAFSASAIIDIFNKKHHS